MTTLTHSSLTPQITTEDIDMQTTLTVMTSRHLPCKTPSGHRNLTQYYHLHQQTPTMIRFRQHPAPHISAIAIGSSSYSPSSPDHPQITNTISPEKTEVFKSLENWGTHSLLPLLKPVDISWKPQDFLPDPSQPSDAFFHEVRALRDRTVGLSDDYFVVLVGHMITEEALPTYQTMLNRHDAVKDETGVSQSPWAVWSRAWTAEENRHGDLLRTYLYLSGRVDMTMVDHTIHYLIGAGMDSGTETNPYLMFVYTSFQERATFIAHGNTARLAKEGGDPLLARICGIIASDEKRHETAYTRIVEKLLEVDPNGIMLAIAHMMRIRINMPAHLMYDGRDPKLLEHFSAVSQRLGIYSTYDYADVLEYFIGRWRLEKIGGLTAEGRQAQEYVCGLAPRIRRLKERGDERAKELKPHGVRFSWIFNKEVSL